MSWLRLELPINRVLWWEKWRIYFRGGGSCCRESKTWCLGVRGRGKVGVKGQKGFGPGF